MGRRGGCGSQVGWRSVQAKVLARQDKPADAERLAREAVEAADETDFAHLRWRALMSLGEVLQLGGDEKEAAAVLARAAEVAEAKGTVVAADRARALARHAVA